MKQYKYQWFALVTLVLTASLPGQYADAKPAAVDNSELSGAEADRAAKQLYKDGDMHYAAGRYEKALENFSQAYELSGRPDLLFNIANVHERLGDYLAAAESLRTYVSLPTATDVSSINERIKRLELNAEEQQKRDNINVQPTPDSVSPQPLQSAAAPVAGNPLVVQKTASPKVESPSRVPAVLVTGLGLALIGGGVTSGVLASNAGSDAEALCSNGICSQAAQSDIDSQKRFALISDISVGLGIATVGVGVYLLLRNPEQRQEKKEGVAFGAGPTSSGWGVSMMGDF